MVSWGPSRAGIKCLARRSDHLIPSREGPHVNERDGRRSPLDVSAAAIFRQRKKYRWIFKILGGKEGFAGFSVLSGDSKVPLDHEENSQILSGT